MPMARFAVRDRMAVVTVVRALQPFFTLDGR
jgi:hypothetical protein